MSKSPAKEYPRYEVITQEDPESGDLIVPIPEPLLKQMGWNEGDSINFNVNERGELILKKK